MRHFKLMILLALTACAPKAVTVTVSNPLSIDRKGEVVEVSASLVEPFKGAFTVTGAEGEVPWQLTSDGKLLFPATVGANGSASYKIAKGQPAPTGMSNPFTDVPSGKYYTNAGLWALQNNITQGRTATTFGPDDACTRGHVVTFLYRAYA